MKEVRQAKNIILFLEKIHILFGAGTAEGAIDAANVLKPSLSRGEIQCESHKKPCRRVAARGV